MAFPIQRPRHLRQHEAFRCRVRETNLTPSDLIYPLFVDDELETALEEFRLIANDLNCDTATSAKQLNFTTAP